MILNEQQHWRTVQDIQRSSLARVQHFRSTSLPPVLCLSSLPPADIIVDTDKENGDRKSPASSRGVIQQIKVSGKCVDTVTASHKPAADCLWCGHSFVYCKYIYPPLHLYSKDWWCRDRRDGCLYMLLCWGQRKLKKSTWNRGAYASAVFAFKAWSCCAVILGPVQLKLQMQFSYRNTAAPPELHKKGSGWETDTQYGVNIILMVMNFSKAHQKTTVSCICPCTRWLKRNSKTRQRCYITIFPLWEVIVNVLVWHRLCFALQGWQTSRHSNAEVSVNTRQTDCQHSGLITVSISLVSVIPWHSSLQEILFYTRAFLTFMYSVIPVIHHV